MDKLDDTKKEFPKKRPTNKQIAEMYYRKMCNARATAQAFGYGRSMFYEWVKKDPELNDMIASVRESFKDDLESIAFDIALKKDTTMTIFLMKTLLKDRGYVEKTETDVNMRPPKINLGEKIE